MNILIVGDIFSKLGRESFERNIKAIKNQKTINFIIVNGENITHGKGMSEKHYKWLMSLGVNVVTLGNHAYQNKSILTFIDDVKNVVRPINFPVDSPGKGIVTINYNGTKISVFQVIGNVFMGEGNSSPFEETDKLLKDLDSDIIICDFHGEATSEKIAFAHHFAGRINVIFGTHTHVQTNDARIINGQTLYITDVGMTGPHEGIIGVKKETIINRYISNDKSRFDPEDNGKSQFNAILIEINDKTHIPTSFDILHVIE